ncbi:MAG: dTDP-4-dehydrorhamnose 3,5-epimerase [Chloroflexi bacterium]|nr:dTDP-4-dehydrorhamnose 3,5-epimerase [Chloroflexota bacterium]
MKFVTTEIQGVILIDPVVYCDERGYFCETFQAKIFSEAGIPTHFVQDNQSGSCRGVLRGLHYQIHQAQGKLVRVVAGEVYDVAVDLRKSSPTCGKWSGHILSAENKRQLWVPPGFAHGFYVLSQWAEVLYKATDFYASGWERTLLWNDPQVNIAWPLKDGQLPIVSQKDSQGCSFEEAEFYE